MPHWPLRPCLGSTLAIYGVDIHPTYQAGISIEQIAAEGFTFMACKVSEGRGTYDSIDWLRRGKNCGLLVIGYHYLRPGDEANQAAVFARQLAKAGVPGMLDAEALASDGKTPILTVVGIHKFLDECAARAAKVPLLYLPRWYWQRMGSPDLSGLPALWASAYVNGTGHADELYESVTPGKWTPYGGLGVEILQFSDRATVAGYHIDVNHYRGTRAEFARLIGVSVLSRGDLDMPAGTIAPGKQVTKLVYPIGPRISQLVARGWLSLASTENGTAKVWLQSPQGGIGDIQNVTLIKDKRWWIELPDGVDQMTIHTDTPGSVGWCLELQPR